MLQEKFGKCSALVTAIVLFLSLLFSSLTPLRAEAASGGTVTMDIELFTIGQGFLVEPVQFDFKEDENVAQLMTRFLETNKFKYGNTGTTENNFYLSYIENIDKGYVHVPAYITEMSNGEVTDESCMEWGSNYDNKGLGEFSYHQNGGWYYSQNGEYPNVGMSGRKPNDGDVIRLQFTLYGIGMDLTGIEHGTGEQVIEMCKRDALVKVMAEANADSALKNDPDVKAAYDNAKELVQNAVELQENIDAAYSALYEAIHGEPVIQPEKINLDVTEKTLFTDSGSFQIKATIEPEDATNKTISWSSTNPEVADVDNNGTVTPLSEGETVIKATMSNGISAEAKVVVKERPITGITLNADHIQLVKDAKTVLKGTLTPSNTTDDKTIQWQSSDNDIASVENGNIAAHQTGEAEITAIASNGMAATCKVTVLEDSAALVKAVEQQIQALPEGSKLTLEDRGAVMGAKASYDALSDQEKAQITEKSKSKLDNAVAIMSTLIADEAAVKDLEEDLTVFLEIEQITVSENERVKQLVELCNTYEGLTGEQQEALSETAKAQIKSCQSKQEDLKKTVEGINKSVNQLKDTESLTLQDAEAVAEALAAYNSLCPFLRDEEATKPGWIDENAYAILTAANQQIKYCYTEAINGLNTGSDLNLEDISTQRFVEAVIQYENTEEAYRPVLNESTTKLMEAGKTAIAAKGHTCGDISVSDLPWYVKLNVQEVKSYAEIEKEVKGTFGSGSEIKALYRAELIDLSSGQIWENNQPVVMNLTFEIEEGTESSVYKLFETDTKPSGLLNRLFSNDRQIDEIEDSVLDFSIFNFSVTLPKTIGVVKASVPITGLEIEKNSDTVTQGGTLQLTAKAVPDNATLGEEGLKVNWSSSDNAVLTISDTGLVTGKQAGKSATVTATYSDNPEIKTSVNIRVEASAEVKCLRDSLNPSIKNALQETADYVLNLEFNAEANLAGSIGYGSQWNVIGLARAKVFANELGIDTSRWQEYFDKFYDNAVGQFYADGGVIKDGMRKKTEYSKFILTLTSIGIDASELHDEANGKTYNVFDHLRNMDEVELQGTNGPIWALIAYKCSDKYTDELPATNAEAKEKYPNIQNPVSEEGLIEYILSKQLGDGGWTLSGNFSDSDLTGMALQALWPYYVKSSEKQSEIEQRYANQVNTAVNKGILRLKQLQSANGGFQSINANDGKLIETEEAICQVVVGLTMLGHDPADASVGFVKNGDQWAMSALMQYHVVGSGFAHILGDIDDGSGAGAGQVNNIATEQGLYTLTAYQRYIGGYNGLYNMNDEESHAGGAAYGRSITDAPEPGSVRQAGGNSVKAPAAKTEQKPGWNFDAAMAKTNLGNHDGLDTETLKKASAILGGCGIGIVVLYTAIMAILQFKKKLP